MSEASEAVGGDYYESRADEYDAVYRKPERQADLRAIEAWLPDVFAGRSVLELACGTGDWTRWIADVARRVIAIDAAQGPLHRAAERGLGPHVHWRRGDAHAPAEALGAASVDLGEPQPLVDAAFAGFWWSHVPRRRLPAFLDALHDCLPDGAPVVFLDNRFVAGSSTPIADIDADGDSHQERVLRDGRRYRVLKNFPDAASLREAVAGRARDVEVCEWPYFWALRYRVAHARA